MSACSEGGKRRFQFPDCTFYGSLHQCRERVRFVGVSPYGEFCPEDLNVHVFDRYDEWHRGILCDFEISLSFQRHLPFRPVNATGYSSCDSALR